MFTYGFSIPLLFLVGTLSLFVQYVLDKILVTYYYKQDVHHNDRLNRVVIQIHKYAPVFFLLWGASTLIQNHCMMTNDLLKPLLFTNQIQSCQHIGYVSLIMFLAAQVLLLGLVFVDFL